MINEKLEKIYYIIQEKGIRKNSIFIFINYFDKNLVNYFENNLSKKTFENIFFRQFFMILKNKNKKQFLDSLLNLLKYKSQIIDLDKKYHFELFIKDFQTGQQIFRLEIFDILYKHYEKYKNLLEDKNFKDGIQKLEKIPIFQIFDGEKFLTFNLVFQIFDKSLDMSDCSNGFTFSVFKENLELYGLSFFIGKNDIFISNIQGFNLNEFKFLINYNKVLLYCLLEVSKKLNKNILGFTNKNHPCRFHTVGKGFYGNYDDIFKNIGMKKLNENYYFGEYKNLRIKSLNKIIQSNIEHNLQKITKYLYG